MGPSLQSAHSWVGIPNKCFMWATFCVILFCLDFPSFVKRINSFLVSSIYSSTAVISLITLQGFFFPACLFVPAWGPGFQQCLLMAWSWSCCSTAIGWFNSQILCLSPARFCWEVSLFPFTSCLSVGAIETRWFSIPLMFPLVVDYSEMFEGCTGVG